MNIEGVWFVCEGVWSYRSWGVWSYLSGEFGHTGRGGLGSSGSSVRGFGHTGRGGFGSSVRGFGHLVVRNPFCCDKHSVNTNGPNRRSFVAFVAFLLHAMCQCS
jgi:hypothetical protein